LPTVLHNAARRFGDIATDITIALGGSNVVIVVTWPDDVDDPGNPGPDPTVVALSDALAVVTDNLSNEQDRVSGLLAERIDLHAQRSELARDKAALVDEKATAQQLLETASVQRTRLEEELAAKQKEIDDLKAGKQ
jgi:hypothetical protein